MVSRKNIKELKIAIKEIEKRIASMKTEKIAVESKGCFSDLELNEREKKINAINKEIHYLDTEKSHILQDIVNIEREKWLKKRR